LPVTRLIRPRRVLTGLRGVDRPTVRLRRARAPGVGV